jgi:hypothetical protein
VAEGLLVESGVEEVSDGVSYSRARRRRVLRGSLGQLEGVPPPPLGLQEALQLPGFITHLVPCMVGWGEVCGRGRWTSGHKVIVRWGWE